jgi:class 3 adenylate cyclase
VTGEPETSYARTPDGVHIAFQILGDGPLDLLCAGLGNMVSIDLRDEEAHLRRFERRLSSFSRYLRFDPRGLGLSDPIAQGVASSIEQGVDDLVSVLDAAGSTRASLYAAGGSSHTALLAAATHPDRVSSLVLVNAHARLVRSPDYPYGVSQRSLDHFIDSVLDLDEDTHDAVDDIDLVAPSLGDDPDFRAWWKRAGQRSASPSSARAWLTMTFNSDVRATLPLVACPTLVLHRPESPFGGPLSRYLADHLPQARLVTLSGRDDAPWAGDSDAVVDEIEEFLTGVRGESGSDRILTTVLFTDIVSSTERAAQTGDRVWHEVLDRHDDMAREEVRRFRGREIKTTGDGILATFDGPARAMRCALAICGGALRQGIEVRAGLHTGEVELRGDDVSGIAVNLAQRVSSLAGPSEVLVSRTVVDLVVGSGIAFDDRGEHMLKGFAEPWQLFAVRPV